ncbi:aminoimidazole riboside kinase [mine drainage metagenome]|uniref:Aminoimidazole riboside kinase n=1 Tax=mine drainage metagenome TaxID=410659 RepID=A0A1J5PB43_9ZZZZ
MLASSRASLLALTLGSQGAVLMTRHGQLFRARETAPVVVVDTVGAGDCFLAGLVVPMLAHRLPADWGAMAVSSVTAQELLCSAVASASLCVMQRGCVPPTREQVLARLATPGVAFTG